MRLRFEDGSYRELKYNPELAARLIFRAQQRDNNVDYSILLSPELSHAEKKKQVEEIEHYLNHYRTAERCGKKV